MQFSLIQNILDRLIVIDPPDDLIQFSLIIGQLLFHNNMFPSHAEKTMQHQVRDAFDLTGTLIDGDRRYHSPKQVFGIGALVHDLCSFTQRQCNAKGVKLLAIIPR